MSAGRGPAAALSRSHITNITLNLSGMILPMLAGVAVVPGLLQKLGQDRFGVLTLAWALVGYFSLLDLGLGRALTQYLAQQDAKKLPLGSQAATARLARRLMGYLGLGWTLVLAGATPWVVASIRMPSDVGAEAPLAWIILAMALPFLMWSTCCTAVLEARSRFLAVNLVRIPSGVGSFCVPWFIALYSTDLRAAMAGLLAMRIATALAYSRIAKQEFLDPAHPPPTGALQSLLKFGGWMTVSNVFGPMLSYFDRFAIAAVLGAAAVAHYTVPFDALSRLPGFPLAMLAVLFPLLTRVHYSVDADPTVLGNLLDSVTRILVAFWLPGMICLAILGPQILNWWVGPELAKPGTPVWQWIAVGVLINGFAHIPHTLLQSSGRTDMIAKLHVSELLPYGLMLWWAISRWGVAGAALTWTLRVAVDTVLLYWLASRHFDMKNLPLQRALTWALAGGAALLFLLKITDGLLPSTRAATWTISPMQLGIMLTTFAGWSLYHLFQFFKIYDHRR